jgi:hypothetical protein
MLEEAPMIDVAKITPTALQDVQPGEFFVPVVQGENRFLGGRLGQTPVLVVLDGEDPFNTAEHVQWSGGGGLVVADSRFVVEIASACPALEAEAFAGSLVIGRGRSLYVVGHNGPDRCEVSLQAGDTDIVADKDDIAFKSWRIVVGGEGNEIELYNFTAAAAAPA